MGGRRGKPFLLQWPAIGQYTNTLWRTPGHPLTIFQAIKITKNQAWAQSRVLFKLRPSDIVSSMKKVKILQDIKKTESPLKRQLLAVALLSKVLEEKGKSMPTVIGGLALSYYTREVYFTADIDLAYSDRKALDSALKEIGFKKRGRYWVNNILSLAIEVPVGVLVSEDSPLEIVELGPGLRCQIIGLEDLIIDRMNACKYWKSEIDCEMVELLIRKYIRELDWEYLRKRASQPEKDTWQELLRMKKKICT